MPNAGPHVIVLGGPNGSGKSTAAPRLLKGALAVSQFVRPEAQLAREGEIEALEAGETTAVRPAS